MDNPYAPPKEHSPELPPLTPRMRQRLEFIPAESVVQTLAFMLVAFGTMVLVPGVIVAVLSIASGAVLFGLAALAPGGIPFIVGRNLQRLVPWSRRAALLLTIPLALLPPFGTWVAFRCASALVSAPGRALFTPDYAELRASTPGMHARIQERLMLMGMFGGALTVLAGMCGHLLS